MRPTPSAASVQPSGIREIFDLAWGKPDMLHLEVGEPDFPTPIHIVEAAFAAARRHTGYTSTVGSPILRDAVSERLKRVHRIDVPVEQIVITSGAAQAIAAIVYAMVAEGDEVLVPDPGWPNLEMAVVGRGGVPVRYPLPAQNGFVPDVNDVASRCTDRTKLLVICSPSNPTGTVIPPDVIEALVHLARERDVLVLSDEVYDEIVFDGREPQTAMHYGDDGVAAVWSCSKTYAMTGWRVGYTAVPRWLLRPLIGIQEGSITCVAEPCQAAAVEALTGPQHAVAEMRDAYEHRRNVLRSLLRDAGIECVVPSGAFYLMLPLSAGADARAAAIDLVSRGVAVAPGTAFGSSASDQLRISLAASQETIVAAAGRITDWYAETDGGLRLL
jgi:aspartate aminotransferase/aminotransferase